MVPIVEPEVLMDGDHDIKTCYQVTKMVLEETFYQLLVHIVSFWKESFGNEYSSKDDGNVLSTPNLIMRAVGCALCGEDVPDKGELQGGAERCMMCCAIFWCSQECKQQGTKLHKCPGTVQVPHVLRANCFDCMIAASE